MVAARAHQYSWLTWAFFWEKNPPLVGHFWPDSTHFSSPIRLGLSYRRRHFWPDSAHFWSFLLVFWCFFAGFSRFFYREIEFSIQKFTSWFSKKSASTVQYSTVLDLTLIDANWAKKSFLYYSSKPESSPELSLEGLDTNGIESIHMILTTALPVGSICG